MAGGSLIPLQIIFECLIQFPPPPATPGRNLEMIFICIERRFCKHKIANQKSLPIPPALPGTSPPSPSRGDNHVLIRSMRFMKKLQDTRENGIAAPATLGRGFRPAPSPATQERRREDKCKKGGSPKGSIKMKPADKGGVCKFSTNQRAKEKGCATQ